MDSAKVSGTNSESDILEKEQQCGVIVTDAVTENGDVNSHCSSRCLAADAGGCSHRCVMLGNWTLRCSQAEFFWWEEPMQMMQMICQLHKVCRKRGDQASIPQRLHLPPLSPMWLYFFGN